MYKDVVIGGVFALVVLAFGAFIGFMSGAAWKMMTDYKICFEDGSCKVFDSAQEIREWYGY